MKARGSLEAQNLLLTITRLLHLASMRDAVISHLTAYNIVLSNFVHDEMMIEFPDELTVEECILIDAELVVLFVPLIPPMAAVPESIPLTGWKK